ncbi:MAG: peptidoglycan bridge formation glycyltransferase FemA/FemB family protein [Lachnospiraceae bacterium]|nr:peptidoglycan bridge formation glycyltransferase FemA/FemB family protein [Lachnospiraceae bacterium]
MERKKKVAFLTIHDVWFDTECFKQSKYAIAALHTNDILEKKDYDFKLSAQTFLLDISQEEEEILSKFEYKSARYAINKAIRDGVMVHKIHTEAEKKQYMEFQKQFCEQKGIPCLHEEELESLVGYYAVSAENEYLGACAFIESGDGKTVRYKYGATKHKLNANEIILWEAIRDYRRSGFQFFDFGGCVPTDDKESYYYRHYHFKKKFGGELIDSYTYFKIKGFYRLFYYIFIRCVQIFFKGDVNEFTNWLNEKKILK